MPEKKERKRVVKSPKEQQERRDADREFVDGVISVKRVTKVTKGGKRFSFSAAVVSGDQKGRVGIGLGRSREVSMAIAKATAQARKALVTIPLRDTTLPYDVKGRHGAALVMLRSASKGTGVIAGGPMRLVMVALGVKDVLAKSLGSKTGVNVVKATLNALAKCRSVAQLAKLRGKTIEQVIRDEHEITQ